MKLSKTMKKLVAYVCTIALVVAGMAGYQAEVSAETDYSTLTYTTVSCDGGEDIAYSIVSNTIVGWNTPWYGDAGNTLQFVYSADNKADDTVVSIDGTETVAGVGAVVMVANALTKINPTALADNSYTSVVITSTTGEAEIIIKKGTPGEAGAEPESPVETTTEAPAVTVPEGFTLLPKGWTTGGSTGAWDIYSDVWNANQYAYIGLMNDEAEPYKIALDFTDTTGGDWLVQAAVTFSGLTVGSEYKYVIMDGDTTLASKTFIAAAETQKSDIMNLGWTAKGTRMNLVATCVEVTEDTDGVPADAKWQGWFEKENWASYAISDDATGYTLTDKNIGSNWYSIQTGVDSVKFKPGVEYVCKFTLTAPQPKEFTVDNRDGDAKVFVEEAAGEWTENEDGTWSYDYEGTYTNTTAAAQYINVRVALGYHNAKDGKTDANYAADDLVTFTLSDFSIAAAGAEEPETTTVAQDPETTTTAVEPEGPVVPDGFTLAPSGDSKIGSTGAWDLYAGDWRDGASNTSYAYISYKNDETDPYKVSLDFTETTTGDWLVQLKTTFNDLTVGTKYEYSIKDGDTVLDSGIFTADTTTFVSKTMNLGWTAQGTRMDIVAVCKEYVAPDLDPDADYIDWLTTDRNLAYGKTAAVSNWKEGSTDTSVLLDGTWDLWNGNYVGTYTPGYFEVDLGEVYDASSIDQVVVWFRNGDTQLLPANGFKVQFGDVTFDTVATVTADDYPEGAVTSQTDGSQYMVPVIIDKDSISGNVKKVRIQVDDAVGWGAQITEIAVYSENPVEGEVSAPAENAAAVTVTSEKSSSITGDIKVNITAGENQDGYTYYVYLDDATSASLSGCVAGQDYTISGVAAGTHTVKVVSFFNGGVSEGIVSDPVEVKTIISDVTDVSKNFALNAVWELSAKEGSTLSHGSAEGDGDITNGIISDSDFVCPAKGFDGAIDGYYIIDLGKEVDASLINSIIVWYRVMEPGCAPQDANSQDIRFSIDKETWTDIASVPAADIIAAREAQGSAPYSVTTDIEAEGTVRYIQVYYPEAVLYGAQVTEIAVFGETGVEAPIAPAAPTGLSHSPAADGSLPHYFAWGAVDGAEAYNIYVNNELVATSTVAGYDLAAYVSAAGTYTIEVTAVAGGVESEKAKVDYTVEGGDTETTTPDASEDSEMTFTTVNGQDTDIEGLGNWSMWLSPSHTMEIAVDPEDADHIQAKMTANNNNWDPWAIQYKVSKYGLTAGESYTMEIDFSADSTDFRPTLDGQTYFNGNQTQTAVTVVAPVTADADGKVGVIVGLGLTGIGVTVDISNIVVKDADGNVVDVKDAPEVVDPTEATTPNVDPTEATTPSVDPTEATTPDVDPTEATTPNVDPTTADQKGTVAPTTTAATVKPSKPGKVKIKKVNKKKKSAKKVKLTLKKISGVEGYQVAVYKTRKNAKKNKKALVKKFVKKIKVTIKSKKLKNKKKLYVRARAYVLDGKTKLYGKWSSVKKVRIKK